MKYHNFFQSRMRKRRLLTQFLSIYYRAADEIKVPELVEGAHNFFQSRRRQRRLLTQFLSIYYRAADVNPLVSANKKIAAAPTCIPSLTLPALKPLFFFFSVLIRDYASF